MRHLNMQKLAALPTADQLLDSKYGCPGEASRAAFDAESEQWYKSQTERGSYHITMPKALYESVRRQAHQSGMSISAFISTIVSRNLQTT